MKWSERKFKLIVSDVDGTLVPEGKHDLDSRFFEIYSLLKEKNIMFCFASGRQYSDLTILAPELNGQVSFIAANGSIIIENGEVIAEIPLLFPKPLDICREILKFEDSDYFISTANNQYINPRHQSAFDLMKDHKDTIFIKGIEDIKHIKDPIVKVSLMSHNNNGVDSHFPYFRQKWGNICNVERSGFGWVDFTNTDKGTAIERLCSLKNISMNDVLAFGDNTNDRTMLNRAGFSGAMKNAHPDVQAEADVIVDDLYQYLLDYLKN